MFAALASKTITRPLKRVNSMLAPSLKIKIQDGDAVEYFWVSSPSITGDGYSGVIDNDPEAVRSVRNGETVSFPRSQIYDWTYEDRQSGKTIGNFTACALLAHQSASDAAEFRRTYRIDCDP